MSLEITPQPDNALLIALEQWQRSLMNADINLTVSELQTEFKQLQQRFQQEILNQSTDTLNSRQQSIQTEIHRTLRLLETELIFLKSSRQGTTTQQRLKTVCDRTLQLMTLTQAFMSLN